jgi:hypothetical protein
MKHYLEQLLSRPAITVFPQNVKTFKELVSAAHPLTLPTAKGLTHGHTNKA